jgi:hypothetical protein
VDLWKDAQTLMEDAKRRKELEMLEERQFWAEIEQVEIALHAFLKKL